MAFVTLFSLCFYLILLNFVEFSNGSVKKGLAVSVHGGPKDGLQEFMCDDIKAFGNIAWWYDWRRDLSFYHENTNCSDIDTHLWNHVPMIWGRWKPVVVDANAIAVLGYNEPNHKDQSNLTPEKAALHWQNIEKNSHGRPLVSPSASPCASSKCHGDTIEWFDEFFRLCNNCTVDYLATHLYVCNADTTMKILKKLYDLYGKKIWLTEFACSRKHDENAQLQYMKDILPRLEAADYIARYAWYMSRITTTGWIGTSASLLHAHSSTLTPLGDYYKNFNGNSAVVE